MQYINTKSFQWFYRGKHCEGKKIYLHVVINFPEIHINKNATYNNKLKQ